MTYIKYLYTFEFGAYSLQIVNYIGNYLNKSIHNGINLALFKNKLMTFKEKSYLWVIKLKTIYAYIIKYNIYYKIMLQAQITNL